LKSSLKTVCQPAGGAGTAALAVGAATVTRAVIAPATVALATAVTSHRRRDAWMIFITDMSR
jgi:hypothetical protein